MELDYGQLEARVIAMFSQDKVFVKALWERYDVHMNWAEKISRAYPARVGGKKNFSDKAVMKEFRNDVKNQFVFPLFFGATLAKTSHELSIPVDSIQPLYDEFWRTFSGVKEYQITMEAYYRKYGYVSCLTGRRRHAPLSYNQIINSPVQGTASDIVVDGMDRLSEMDIWEYQACLNVHDSLMFLIEEDEIEERAEVIIKEMLNYQADWVNVPLVVEMSIGTKNWADMTAVGEFASNDWLNHPKRPEWL